MSPRNVSEGVLADFRSETPKKVVLVQIATGSADTPYLRYTTREHVVIWAGVDWTPRPLEVDDTTLDAHTETAGPRLRLMDLDNVFGALIDAGYDFAFKRVRIVRTAESATEGSGSEGVIDDWFIDHYERAGGAISFDLKPMVAAFSQPIPLRRLSRALFPGIPDPD